MHAGVAFQAHPLRPLPAAPFVLSPPSISCLPETLLSNTPQIKEKITHATDLHIQEIRHFGNTPTCGRFAANFPDLPILAHRMATRLGALASRRAGGLSFCIQDRAVLLKCQCSVRLSENVDQMCIMSQ